MNYHEINSYEKLNLIYNNKYRDTEITYIAIKSQIGDCFSIDDNSPIELCFHNPVPNFKLSISPIYSSDSNYLISTIHDYDYSTPLSSDKIIRINGQRKAIIKISPFKFFQIYDIDINDNKIEAGIANYTFQSFESSIQISYQKIQIINMI